MRIALELARHNNVYEDIATKFFEHFLHIAEAMNGIGDRALGLWDEADQFLLRQLACRTAGQIPLRVRSLVGLIPLFAVETLEPDAARETPRFHRRLEWFLNHRPRPRQHWFPAGTIPAAVSAISFRCCAAIA